MQISNSQAHLHSIELRCIFRESRAFPQVREQLAATHESHNEEDLGISLEHVFHSDEEGMVSHDQDVLLQLGRLDLIILQDDILAQ